MRNLLIAAVLVGAVLGLTGCMSNAEMARYSCIEEGRAMNGGNFSHLPPCVEGDKTYQNGELKLVKVDPEPMPKGFVAAGNICWHRPFFSTPDIIVLHPAPCGPDDFNAIPR